MLLQVLLEESNGPVFGKPGCLLIKTRCRIIVEAMINAWIHVRHVGLALVLERLFVSRPALIDTFIEFGGGLGKGETPAEKRPNLESIIKKTLKVSGHEAEYNSAINTETLAACA